MGGLLFGNGIRYLFVGLLARTVGVNYLGLYSLANAITRFIEVIGKAGLDRGILRFVSMHSADADKKEIRGDILSATKMGAIFSILVMLVQIILAGWLAVTVFNEGRALKMVILANAVALPFSIISLIMASASQGFKLLKYKIFTNNIIGPVAMVFSVLIALRYFPPEIVIMVPFLASAIFSAISAIYFMKHLIDFSAIAAVKASFNCEILKFSYPLMFVTILGTLMHWMDVMMLGYFTDSSVVGLYYPAARTAGLMRTILLAFMSIFSPMLSEMHSNGRADDMAGLYKLVIRWILTLAVPLAMILFLFPGKIMLLFGGDYLASTGILIILTIAAVVQAFVGAAGSTITMTGHPKINLINSVIILVVNTALNLVLIPRFGAPGAAWATCISMIALGIIRTAEVWNLVRLQPLSWKLIKPFTAGTVLFISLRLLKPMIMPLHTVISLIIITLVGLICYITVLVILRPDQDDRQVWQGILMIRKNRNKE